MASTPTPFLTWPFSQQYSIIQPWGPTSAPFEIAEHGYAHWHSGIDITAPCGTPILAPAAGRVIFAGHDTTGYGAMTQIQHTGGIVTLYGHQSRQDVLVGEDVVAGQQIGLSGGGTGNPYNDGNSQGCHLHFGVFTNGADWQSDVNPMSYLTGQLAAAVAASAPVPPAGGASGVSTTPPVTGSGTSATDSSLPPAIGADKSPIPIKSVAPAQLRQNRKDPAAGIALGGQVVAVESLTVTLPGYRAAGSWNATIPLESKGAGAGAAALSGAGRSQVLIYLGYVDDIRTLHASQLSRLPLVFTGLLDGGADFDYEWPRMQLTLSGPDLSGLLSTESAAAADLSALLGNGYKSMTSFQVASLLARNHGLSVRGSDSGVQVGSYDGQSTLSTRTSGRTEWDLLTQLAQAEGKVCYMDGTTLVFDRVAAGGKSTTLTVGSTDRHPLITRVRVRPQPHSLRDYRIVVQSWSTDNAANASSQSVSTDAPGDNPDSTQVVTVTAKPNMTQEQLDTYAASIGAQYAATETIVEVTAQGPLPVSLNQQMAVQGAPVGGGSYYPVTISYSYTTADGITCTVQGTSRPFALQSTATAAAGF